MRTTPDPSVTWEKRPLASLDLAGRTVAVIGGTDGLGRAIARALAERGASVRVVGRTFRDDGVKNLTFTRADLSSMREARKLGAELPVEGVSAVLLTAGIMAAPQRETTAEGVERDIAVSYLWRWVMLQELAPRLAAGTRVFVMGFPGTGQLGNPDDLNAERSYQAMPQHMNTVAGNEALIHLGPRRWPQLKWFGLNPGLVKTNIRANYMGAGSFLHRASETVLGWFTQSPETYASRIAPLLVAPELDRYASGAFGNKGDPIKLSEGFTPERADKFDAASKALAEKALG